MPTTVVFPSLDVSGTGSISTIISTAGTFAGSLTASTLAVTGTATFSGTAVFVGTAQFLATVTFSATVAFMTTVKISGTLSVGFFKIAGNAFNISLSQSVADGQVLTYNNTDNKWRNVTPTSGAKDSLTYTAAAIYVKGTSTFSGAANFLTTMSVSGAAHFVGGVTFDGTVSFSATVAFLNATVTTLGVGSTASFSSAVLISGFPAGSVLLGSLSISAPLAIRFSGSWSDYAILELFTFFKSTPSGSVNIDLFTDGGTTAILTLGGLGSATASHGFMNVKIYNGTAFKGAHATRVVNAVAVTAASATANTAATINCIGVRVGTSLTLSSGLALLYGRRR